MPDPKWEARQKLEHAANQLASAAGDMGRAGDAMLEIILTNICTIVLNIYTRIR